MTRLLPSEVVVTSAAESVPDTCRDDGQWFRVPMTNFIRGKREVGNRLEDSLSVIVMIPNTDHDK